MMDRKHCGEKEKRLVLQTRKNQGLFGRGLKTFLVSVLLLLSTALNS